MGQPKQSPEFKVRFFFNDSELPLLDSCEFPCKFHLDSDPQSQFKFCGFAYPAVSKDLDALKQWSSRFPKAQLFTYGDKDRVGEFVSMISGSDDVR